MRNRTAIINIVSVIILCLCSGCKSILEIIDIKKKQIKVEETVDIDFPEFGRTWVIPEVGIALQPIQPATYIMGSLDETDTNANPWHYVTLSKPFWMGKHEITQEEYTRVVENNPSYFISDHRPVERVSWYDAERFCMVLTVLETGNDRVPEGYIYRLPTESEWEYCCRAGGDKGYTGKLITATWYNVNSGSTSHDVGIKAPNNFGLYDMLGNVSEWCIDRDGIYQKESVIDPMGPAKGVSRIIRGGSWFNSKKYCTARYRYFMNADNTNHYVGFRVVLAPGKLDYKYIE